MEVLLIQPGSPEEGSNELGSLQYPFNLGYLASVLRDTGHTVRMLDFNVIDIKRLPSFISEYKPSMVGLTAMAPTIQTAEKIIKQVKSIDSRIATALGGVFASAMPIETMKNIMELDYLIFGEGELTIVNLANRIAQKKSMRGVKGVVYRSGKKILMNQPQDLIKDLDSIPFPARDLLPLELYAKRHVVRGVSRRDMNVIEMFTSRGCPNQCIFCASNVVYRRTLRYRSYENIIGEIEECIKKYKANHITFMDDTFTINKALVRKICGFFKEKKMTWDCNARVDCVNYELLKQMALSGCIRISFGVESGSNEILKKVRKNITVEQVVNAVRSAKQSGIRYVECCFMVGSHVDETPEDVKATERLIRKLNPDILALSIMCPFPGTEIYDMMIERGYLDRNPDWSQFTLYGNLNRYKRITYMDSEQMARLQNKIVKRFYTSPRYIFSQLAQIRTLKEFKYYMRMGKTFFKGVILNQ